MRMLSTPIADVFMLVPVVHGDQRGFFMEVWNRRTFGEVTGLDVDFVQDNHSRSARGVLRGLHYQVVQPQGKLVRVTGGAVWDVAVDIRRRSPSFRRWFGVELSEENKLQLWVPPGFAHGFLTLTETADVLYKTTEYFEAELDRSLRWDDPEIGIEWPLQGALPILSQKDVEAPLLGDAEVFDGAIVGSVSWTSEVHDAGDGDGVCRGARCMRRQWRSRRRDRHSA